MQMRRGSRIQQLPAFSRGLILVGHVSSRRQNFPPCSTSGSSCPKALRVIRFSSHYSMLTPYPLRRNPPPLPNADSHFRRQLHCVRCRYTLECERYIVFASRYVLTRFVVSAVVRGGCRGRYEALGRIDAELRGSRIESRSLEIEP